MLSYEEAIKEQKRIEANLLGDNNVESVKVVPERDAGGEKTGFYCIKINVFSKHDFQDFSKPMDMAKPGLLCPYKVDEAYIIVEVVKPVVKITPEPDGYYEYGGVPQDEQYQKRIRPIHSGVGIGPARGVHRGTLGPLLKSTANSDDNIYALTAKHVAADHEGKLDCGDRIIQPSIGNGGVPILDEIGMVVRWNSKTDTALIRLNPNVGYTLTIPHIGTPQGMSKLTKGMVVEKLGSSSGHTKGIVLETDLVIRYKESSSADDSSTNDYIVQSSRVTNMTHAGDSGSGAVEGDNWVGSLIAGDSKEPTRYSEGMPLNKKKHSYFVPLEEQLDEIRKPYTATSRSGQIQHFPPLPPFKVLTDCKSVSSGMLSVKAYTESKSPMSGYFPLPDKSPISDYFPLPGVARARVGNSGCHFQSLRMGASTSQVASLVKARHRVVSLSARSAAIGALVALGGLCVARTLSSASLPSSSLSISTTPVYRR